MLVVMATSTPIPGDYNGTAMHAIKLVRELKRQDIDVIWTYLRFKGKWGFKPKRSKFEGAIIYDIPFPFWKSGLDRIIDKHKPQLIHAQTYGAANRVLLTNYAKKTPLIYEVHSLFGEEIERDKLGRGLSYQINKYMERKVCKYSSHVIVLSEAVKKVFIDEKGVSQDRISVIYPGLDLQEFWGLGLNPAKIEGINENEKVVMYVGGFGTYSGIYLFLKSIPIVIKQIPNIKFVFVGGPKEWIEANRDAYKPDEDSIIFLTDFHYKDIPSIIERADVLVHPRLDCRENYSTQTRIGLFLASGKPIVATKVADYNLFLGETRAGYLCEVNPQSIADGLCRVLSNRVLQATLSEKAKNVAGELFDINKNARKYIKIYQEIVENFKT
jgi:glycosyltransferase involved in cell wall biosynthesis